MMKILLLALLFAAGPLLAANLNIKPGYWEYKTNLEENPMVQQALAQLKKMPAEQRAMMEKMMKDQLLSEKVKKQYNCITSSDIADWESRMQKELIKGDHFKDCKFVMLKKTAKIFKGTTKCPSEAKNIAIEVNMKSKTQGTTKIIVSASPKPISTSMKWLSSKCPK